MIQQRYDCNPTMMYRMHLLPFDMIRRQQKMNMSTFCRGRVVSCIVVESNANCNFDHFRRSQVRRGIVIS